MVGLSPRFLSISLSRRGNAPAISAFTLEFIFISMEYATNENLGLCYDAWMFGHINIFMSCVPVKNSSVCYNCCVIIILKSDKKRNRNKEGENGFSL